MAVMKIGGKDPSNNASAVTVDANGGIYRGWRAVNETILNSNYSSQSQSKLARGQTEVGSHGLVSLRVENSTTSRIRLRVYKDISLGASGTTDPMRDVNGGYIEVICPASVPSIITPDDFPILNYLRYVNLQVVALDAPASEANVTVTVCAKG